MIEIKIPGVALKEIKVLANNRNEAIKKTFNIIENNECNIKWNFVRSIDTFIHEYNLLPKKLYINEEIIENNEVQYLISVPCTSYIYLKVNAENEKDAIETAFDLLKNIKDNNCFIHSVKAHEEIDLNSNEILKNIEVNVL